jgi:biotin carboxylase
MNRPDAARQDALICLAAGESQISLLAKAKSLGHLVVAVDRDVDALGFAYAEVAICQSTYDAGPIIKELDVLSDRYRWIGILNRSSGPPVAVAAELSEYLDIPGVPVAAARVLVHKDRLRMACIEYDIPVPAFRVLAIDERTPDVAANEWPVVTKPALSLVGKSGIRVVPSAKHMDSAIDDAVQNTINGKIIIEEYLPGPDLTLVSFVHDTVLCPICLLEELNVETETGEVVSRGYRTHSPAGARDWAEEIYGICQRLIDTLKINRSPLMVSFRVAADGGLRLMEVHLDLGGDLLMEEVLPRALPFDFEELAVKMSIGEADCPRDALITPTAIFYDRGEELLPRRGFHVFTAESYRMLTKKIMEAGV